MNNTIPLRTWKAANRRLCEPENLRLVKRKTSFGLKRDKMEVDSDLKILGIDEAGSK